MSGIDFDTIPPDGSSGTPDRDEVRAMIQEEILRWALCLEMSAIRTVTRHNSAPSPTTIMVAADAYREGRNAT